jgi:6-phosphogluconolactonase
VFVKLQAHFFNLFIMKLKFLLLLLISIFFTNCAIKSNNFLVGTYTDNTNQGINVIQFNESDNTVSLINVEGNIENPSFVITNKTKTIVVAVEETASENGGKVTSFSFDSKLKTFKKINSFFTKGDHPCTLTFSPKEDFVLVGNYSGGNLSVFPIDKNGKLSDKVEFIQYEGNSVNTQRQEKPHVHCIVLHPKENKIFVADLGSDNIKMIPFDENSKSFLQKNKEIDFKVNPGSGPRHLVWNKAGTKLYVTYELTNEVAIFNYKNNDLQHLQTVQLTSPTKSGSTAELRLSNDEHFLYASTRGNDNQIAVIDVSYQNATVIQTIKTAKTPRNFIITKNQKNVLVATQGSSLISVFNRDIKTGLLTATSNEISINKPVYLYPF